MSRELRESVLSRRLDNDDDDSFSVSCLASMSTTLNSSDTTSFYDG